MQRCFTRRWKKIAHKIASFWHLRPKFRPRWCKFMMPKFGRPKFRPWRRKNFHIFRPKFRPRRGKNAKIRPRRPIFRKSKLVWKSEEILLKFVFLNFGILNDFIFFSVCYGTLILQILRYVNELDLAIIQSLRKMIAAAEKKHSCLTTCFLVNICKRKWNMTGIWIDLIWRWILMILNFRCFFCAKYCLHLW